MKKKGFGWIFAIVLSAAFALSSCGGGGGPSHKHAYDAGVCTECGAVEGLQFEYRSTPKPTPF